MNFQNAIEYLCFFYIILFRIYFVALLNIFKYFTKIINKGLKILVYTLKSILDIPTNNINTNITQKSLNMYIIHYHYIKNSSNNKIPIIVKNNIIIVIFQIK
jgi:hypothetical protein